LIAASIMSKKIAAGAEGIVLDVKVGNGAFMKSLADARVLAESMQELGRGAGRQVVALLTDMDQPLGWAIGNAIEIEEVRAMLTGAETPPDLFSLAIQAAGQLLALSDLDIDAAEGIKRAEQAVDDGSAAELFERWIAAQGGDLSAGLPTAPLTRELTADRDGFVGEVSALGLGRVALELGAGRRTTDDAIDHAVGIRCFAKRGDPLEAGQPLAVVYGRDEAGTGRAVERIQELIGIVDEPQPPRPIVLETLA
jgi:thymidine phosphorylase